MKRIDTFDWRKLIVATAGIFCAMGSPLSFSQDDEAPQVKVRPSEMAPLAPTSLLLGVANTGKHLIAVGDRGNIVASNDGKEWAQVEVPVRATLTAVTFSGPDRGWAVGHDAVILNTTDGGKSWQLQNFQPELEMPLLDVYFSDENNGIAIGAYGLMLSTSDGGVNWQDADAPSIREDELHFNKISTLGNGELILVGESGMIGVSSDGSNWERLESPYEGSLYGAIPRGQSGALVYGLRGNVYVTDDVRSGQWTQIDTGTVASFFGGTKLASGHAVLVGLAGEYAIVAPNGAVRVSRVEATAGVTGAGTLASAIPWQGGVLVVGELGVSAVGL